MIAAATFTQEEVDRALNDAVALAREMDGAGLPVKLAQFQLDAEVVAHTVQERWEAYKDDVDHDAPDARRLLFIRAYTEAMLVGRKLPAMPEGHS